MSIFVVGFARSGTTLCQRLVSERFGLPTLPETHFFERLDYFHPVKGRLTGANALALVHDLRKKRYLELDTNSYADLAQRDWVQVKQLLLRIIADQLGVERPAALGQWLEKTPGHGWHLHRIAAMFPQARFIWMLRDPVLAFASRRELAEPGKGWGEQWKPIEIYCDEWSRMMAVADDFAAKFPKRLLHVRLEDLAAAPDPELLRIADFLNDGFAGHAVGESAPIVLPFESWKLNALRPADSTIAARSGRGQLSGYETWRVRTLLADGLAKYGYPTDAEAPALDDMHRIMLRSIDHLRAQVEGRDTALYKQGQRLQALEGRLAAGAG